MLLVVVHGVVGKFPALKQRGRILGGHLCPSRCVCVCVTAGCIVPGPVQSALCGVCSCWVGGCFVIEVHSRRMILSFALYFYVGEGGCPSCLICSQEKRGGEVCRRRNCLCFDVVFYR